MMRGLLDDVGAAFQANADPERAVAMSAYMRDQFTFYGIPAPLQRSLAREVLAHYDTPDEAQLRSIVLDCWRRPEREWQYFACDLLAKHAPRMPASLISTARTLISAKGWWDTVDNLAIKTVGSLVRNHDELVARMDEWIGDDDVWVARTAILHQISYKRDTDAKRLFGYCTSRASDTDFFMRKAIGWALREYSKTDADAVRAFVQAHDAELSGLSKREALRKLSARLPG